MSVETERNKAVYSRFIQEVFNEGHFDAFSELLAPDYTIEDAPPGAAPGAEGVKQVVKMFRGAFPDLQITLDELVAESDSVAARSTLRGTHRGAFMGIEPTGRSVAITTLTLVHLKDGRLVASWVKNDIAALMRQLGAG
ncbi:MAG TPA: ester cyclase [Dehalococcoidia bacterium]|nr:ester cyclase [Dehalococcoidia bacterium]